MNIKNAFSFRDQIALKEIMNTLEPLTEKLTAEETQKIEDSIWECFIQADKKWESEFLPGILPAGSASDFLKKIKTPSPL